MSTDSFLEESGKKALTIIQTALLCLATAMSGWVVHTVHQQELSIIRIEATLERQSRNRWTSTHQKIWVGDLKALNPALTIPNPSDTVSQYGDS